MKNCEFFNCCPIFKNTLFKDSDLVTAVQTNYCQNRKECCARYQIATKAGKKFVPDSLLPFMNEKASIIISERTE